jgi:hypothetical protein
MKTDPDDVVSFFSDTSPCREVNRKASNSSKLRLNKLKQAKINFLAKPDSFNIPTEPSMRILRPIVEEETAKKKRIYTEYSKEVSIDSDRGQFKNSSSDLLME